MISPRKLRPLGGAEHAGQHGQPDHRGTPRACQQDRTRHREGRRDDQADQRPVRRQSTDRQGPTTKQRPQLQDLQH